jgi:Uridylate kinase
MADVKYQRIMLKLSGEALAGDKGFGINPPVIKTVAQEIRDVYNLGVQIAIVVGGGNMWRGVAGSQMGMERPGRLHRHVSHHHERFGPARQLGIHWGPNARADLDRDAANRWTLYSAEGNSALGKGTGRDFCWGTGSPYFSTDTTAALRAAEINADAILMAKNGVDGIYSADPKKDPNAVKFDQLTQLDIINKGLHVMDTTASSFSMDNDIPVVVFNLNKSGNIRKVVEGANIGTTVYSKG